MPFFGQELFLAAQEKGPLTDQAYLDALAFGKRRAGAEGIDAVMEQHKLDALVAPSVSPAYPIDWVNGDHFLGASSSPARDRRLSQHLACPAASTSACRSASPSSAGPSASRCCCASPTPTRAASQSRRPPESGPPSACLRRAMTDLSLDPLPAGDRGRQVAPCCSATASARVCTSGFQYGSLKDKAEEAGLIGEEVGRPLRTAGHPSISSRSSRAWSRRKVITAARACRASRSSTATRPTRERADRGGLAHPPAAQPAGRSRLAPLPRRAAALPPDLTTNYDLLLYWIAAHREQDGEGLKGFRDFFWGDESSFERRQRRGFSSGPTLPLLPARRLVPPAPRRPGAQGEARPRRRRRPLDYPAQDPRIRRPGLRLGRRIGRQAPFDRPERLPRDGPTTSSRP